MPQYPNLQKHGIRYVTTDTETRELAPYLETWNRVGADTETHTLDPHSGYLRLLQLSNGTDKFVFDIYRLTGVAKEILASYMSDPRRQKIFHNAKFDVKFLKKHLGIVEIPNLVCTMLTSKLVGRGNESLRHSLTDTLERFLSITVDKTEQTSDWTRDPLTESQIIYAATDAVNLIELFDSQWMFIRKYGMEGIWKIEMDAIEPVAEMELNGLHLNYDRWVERADQDKAECKETEWEIYQICDSVSRQQSLFAEPEVFNINSQQQLRPKLKALGIILPTKTESDGTVKETTDKNALKEMEHVHPVIALLIKQKELNKAWTSYGRNWKQCINPVTGRIHPNLNQIGAMTGRFTTGEDLKSDSMEPPVLGIPAKKAYRNCFDAENGNVMVWADYSQLELRILAELSGEEKMIQAFWEGTDLHRLAAHLAFHVDVEEVTDEQRRIGKDLNYALAYGVGYRRFAMRANIPDNDAKTIISNYFRGYPRLKSWLDGAAWEAVKFKRARTLGGRLVTFQFNENVVSQVSQAQRNGKNTPIQGTNADMLKVALRLFYDYTRDYPIRMVLPVHDEILSEARKEFEELAKEILEDAMMEAGQRFLKHVPVKVDVKSGPYWEK